jgi:hypothetical protein
MPITISSKDEMPITLMDFPFKDGLEKGRIVSCHNEFISARLDALSDPPISLLVGAQRRHVSIGSPSERG